MTNRFGIWKAACNSTALLAVTKCDAGRQYQLRRKKITCSLTVKSFIIAHQRQLTFWILKFIWIIFLKCISPCVENELQLHYKNRLVNFVEIIIVYRLAQSRKEPISLVTSVPLSHTSTWLSMAGDPWNFILGSLKQKVWRNSIIDYKLTNISCTLCKHLSRFYTLRNISSP